MTRKFQSLERWVKVKGKSYKEGVCPLSLTKSYKDAKLADWKQQQKIDRLVNKIFKDVLGE